jgi:transcriptional regulator with XRE-family HTH domain
VPARIRAVDGGNATGRRLVLEVSRELETARLSAGLSYAEIGRGIGISGGQVARICQGRSPDVSVRRLAQIAATLGLTLSSRTFPDGSPIRDRAHLDLLRRLRARLRRALSWRVEVPVVELASVGAPDSRTWDAAVDGLGVVVRVEAETHVRDVQGLERRLRLKQRDGRIDVVILLLNDTAHHRRLLADGDPGLSAMFPISTRGALAALSSGRSPGANAIVLL